MKVGDCMGRFGSSRHNDARGTLCGKVADFKGQQLSATGIISTNKNNHTYVSKATPPNCRKRLGDNNVELGRCANADEQGTLFHLLTTEVIATRKEQQYVPAVYS